MKKIFSSLLVFAIILSLCACGGNNNQMVSEAENENNIIEFTDVVLIDDSTIKIELVNFYSKDVNWSEGKQNEKCITFKATNKTDHEISIDPGKFYLNDEEAYVCMIDGSMTPDSGKSGQYSFYVGYKATPEHKALESLDVLYDLEGSFDVLNIFEDRKKNNSYEPKFSIKNALNPDSKESSEKELEIYTFDDTVATDVVEFKVTRREFANKVAFGTEDTYYRPTTETKGLSAGENKTFFAFTFEIKNISSSKIAESDICGGNVGDKFTVIYDGKYEFNNGFYSDSVLLNDSSLAYIDPLETREMRGLIKCASEVAVSEDKTLYLDVILPSSNGEKSFRYSIH